MGHPFSHPKGRDLLKRVADFFKSDRTFIDQNSHIVFVCGGPTDINSMRKRFCDYSIAALPSLRVFISEVAQRDLLTNNEPAFYPITDFEELISAVSDCIILFPESPGSFAELGFFANNRAIRKKLLVASDAGLQGKDSFISLGPIHYIDKYSVFKPTIQLEYGDPNFDLVRDRLALRIVGKNRKRFIYTAHAKLLPRERFFCIFEILKFFPFLNLEGVEYAYRSIFTSAKPSEIKQFISILVAAGYVSRCGLENENFSVAAEVKSFLDFVGVDRATLRLSVLDHYRYNVPEMAPFVNGVAT